MLIPIWFLVLALFLPRISLFILWIHGWAFGIPQPGAGLVWFFLPRVLVLLLIYTALGFHPWFWIHVGAAGVAWISSANRAANTSSKES